MPLIAVRLCINGDMSMINYYTREKIDEYKKTFEEIKKNTISEFCNTDTEFKHYYSNLSSLEKLSYSIPDLKMGFDTYLKNKCNGNDGVSDDPTFGFWKKFEKQIISKLQGEFGNVKLDEHIKKVIGRYYMTCDNIEDWIDTVGVIEVFKEFQS